MPNPSSTACEECDCCGHLVYVDKDAAMLPFPVRNWHDGRLHSCDDFDAGRDDD